MMQRNRVCVFNKSSTNLEQWEYIQEFKTGSKPSILSAADAINCPVITEKYPKLLNDIAVHDLRMYLEYFCRVCARNS